MTPLTLYLHGQGISNTTARAHCAWIRQVTKLDMTPLLYHDLVDVEPISLFGLPLRAPLATAADVQIDLYLTDLARRTADTNDALLDTTAPDIAAIDLARARIFETYRSSLRYLLKHHLNDDVRDELRRQLEALVAESPAPIRATLVAHSLGSVIALDLLRSLPPGMTIDRLVTLGSPLGLITSLPGRIADYMVPVDHRQLDIPWHDFAAEGDLLATAQRMSHRRQFQAAPLTVSTIIGDFDNPHECYFIDTQVAQTWTEVARWQESVTR